MNVNKKNNKFLVVVYVLLIIVVMIGTTFSYFSYTAKSDDDVVQAKAGEFGIRIEVLPLYVGKDLIPMNDEDVIKGYENECIDKNNYRACYAFTIHIENTGTKYAYDGTINFNVSDIANLKYLLLDENNERYVDSTAIVSDTDQTLGNSFELDKDETKDFVLIVWLTNLEHDQAPVDAGGMFNASVTYTSSLGNRITGSISN